MKLELLPMAFDENVAVFAMFPAMVDPLCVLMRRPSPLAGRPYVPVSVPTMIAFRPNVTRPGRHRPRLNHGRGRTHFYDYLCAHRKDAAGNQRHYEFSQHCSTPFSRESLDCRCRFRKRELVYRQWPSTNT
jgi:hypothetical protein